MKTMAFARSYWISFLPVTLVFLIWLHLIWVRDFRKLPPPVAAPVWGKSYVAQYDLNENHGNIDYYLFHTGILGFQQRLNQADLVLFGSSHVLYGLSAGQLGQKLSAAAGHPVKVFNAAESGSCAGSVREVIKNNKIHGKPVLLDLFAFDYAGDNPMPDFMSRAFNAESLKAYIQVSKCWTDFWKDWLLDSLLPNFRIGNPFRHSNIIIRKRFLKFTTIRNSQNGDCIALWVPPYGPVYPSCPGNPGLPINKNFKPYASAQNGAIGQPLKSNFIKEHNIRPIYTLIPYSGYDVGIIPVDAQPFIPMSPDGLLFSDGTHLTGEGRNIATQKLFEGLKNTGIRIGPTSAP